MKKISYLLISVLAAVLCFTGCRNDEPVPTPQGDAIKSNVLVEAICNFYANWEEEREIPSEFTVGDKTLTLPEFLYAEAAELIALSEGKKDDIVVLTYKAASNPDRDSYDQSEIAVQNGPKDGKGVNEDLVTLAGEFLANAKEKNQIPNQTLVYRGSDALAFSTNRMTVTIARAIAAYAEAAAFPAKVSTEYLSASTTLKAFAQEFVKYLDVWEENICESLSADGSHCEANHSAWEMVHFIPIPQDTKNDWADSQQGGQWDVKYQPYKTVEIEGTTYTAAQCWEIAIRGMMDMCTTTGQAFLETMARNTEIPFGDGLSLTSAPISRPSDACIWGKYPWYESANDGGAVKYNGDELTEVGIEFILKCCSWHVTRSFIANANNEPLGMIGNFQVFGKNDSSLILEGYEGLISPMREFLILARFYKYLLDNNITKDVYTALKDVKVDFDLYNQQLAVAVNKTSLSFEAQDTEAQEIKVTATEDWTATPAESWIHVSPASGSAGETVVTVTVDSFKEETPRNGSIEFATTAYKKNVSVTQNAYVKPAEATLWDFAQQFVTLLNVWDNTVGTVDAEGTHNGATAWQNVHLLPIINPNAGYTNEGNQYDQKYAPFWKVTLGDDEFSSNQCWEIAIRGLMDLCTTEGDEFLPDMTDRNKAYTLANGVNMDATIPSYSSNNQWGAYPWYETDDRQVTKDGSPVKEVGIDFILKCGSWHIVRGLINNSGNSALGMIGNYQEFGLTSGTLMLDGYEGLICPMRELLICARIYDYIVNNNIKENVYDAIKNVKFDYDLYGVALPDLVQKTVSVKAAAAGETLDATFIARADWTATPSADWITVEPASGTAAAPVEIAIKVAANEGEAREGKVTIAAGSMSIDIAVTQEEYVAPQGATLKDFAKEFVKVLDVWNSHVGKVDADGTHNTGSGTAWENVHFVPITNPNNIYGADGNQYDAKYTPWTVTVGEKTYTSAQCWEIAIRGLMNLVTAEGEEFLAGMTDRNKAYTLANNATLSTAPIPDYTSCCEWGNTPWYEFDQTVTYNGNPIETVDINFLIKVSSWFVVRGLINNPGNNRLGKIGNYQEFGTTSGTLNLDGYVGFISPMRVLLICARAYKYMLDNNIDANVYDAIKNAQFDFELYDQVNVEDKSIKAFAKEYVKLLSVWQNNIGEVQIHETIDPYTNVHYIPADSKINVAGTEYNISEALEMAMRCYMLMMGFDGTSTTSKGYGKFAAVTPAKLSDNMPDIVGYGYNYWYMETPGNGGPIRYKGAANTVYSDVLENYSERNINYPSGNSNKWSNVSGYPRDPFNDYSGCLVSGRVQMAFLHVFKMLLDNNVNEGIAEYLAGKPIDCTLWGVEEYD